MLAAIGIIRPPVVVVVGILEIRNVGAVVIPTARVTRKIKAVLEFIAPAVSFLLAALGALVTFWSPRRLMAKVGLLLIFVLLAAGSAWVAYLQQRQSDKLQAELQEAVTGGSAFVYLAPQPIDKSGRVSFAALCRCKYALNNVRVKVYDDLLDDPAWDGKPIHDFSLLSVPAEQPIAIDAFSLLPTPEKRGEHAYHFEIIAQNGIVDEQVVFRPSHDQFLWEHLVVVTKRQRISEIGQQTPEQIKARTLINQGWHSWSGRK